MERQYFLWSAGGSTVSVAFAPALIKRLRQAAVSPDGSEVGGILLGLRDSDDGITIEDFELLPSEHRRGKTFTLSQADRRKLGQRLRASRNGLENVGSFRTHLRQGLYMDQYDFDLMSTHFASPADIMLLIRPTDWQAGVFVWEEGDIRRQNSYQEFPFDAALLPLTPLDLSGAAGINSDPNNAKVPATALAPLAIPAKIKPSITRSLPLMPTLAKVGLVAATFGLVGLLAFFAHGHRAPVSTVGPQVPHQTTPRAIPPQTDTVHPPVDPNAAQAMPDLSDEMHIKVASLDRRPSPFEPPERVPFPDVAPALKSSPSHATALEPPQPATPPAPLPPLQSAANLTPVVAPVLIKPERPPVIPQVSLEPAQPGMISRGINKIPVLNLLQRQKYRAGDKFLPAKPIRQVKPRMPEDVSTEAGYPSPVDVKVWIDKTGQVTKAELLSDHAEPEIADIAANAALKWTFEPARLADNPVNSEMVMHFRFTPKQRY